MKMPKWMVTIVLVAAIMISQSGCAVLARNGANIGTALGTIAAMNNNDPTFIALGLLGGLFVQAIQEDMDRQDQEKLAMALSSTPAGQPTKWANPETGNQFEVTPWAPYTPTSNSPKETSGYGTCRDAQIASVVGGQTKVIQTTACMDSSQGAWKVVASK